MSFSAEKSMSNFRPKITASNLCSPVFFFSYSNIQNSCVKVILNVWRGQNFFFHDLIYSMCWFSVVLLDFSVDTVVQESLHKNCLLTISIKNYMMPYKSTMDFAAVWYSQQSGLFQGKRWASYVTWDNLFRVNSGSITQH